MPAALLVIHWKSGRGLFSVSILKDKLVLGYNKYKYCQPEFHNSCRFDGEVTCNYSHAKSCTHRVKGKSIEMLHHQRLDHNTTSYFSLCVQVFLKKDFQMTVKY